MWPAALMVSSLARQTGRYELAARLWCSVGPRGAPRLSVYDSYVHAQAIRGRQRLRNCIWVRFAGQHLGVVATAVRARGTWICRADVSGENHSSCGEVTGWGSAHDFPPNSLHYVPSNTLVYITGMNTSWVCSGPWYLPRVRVPMDRDKEGSEDCEAHSIWCAVDGS